jgi:hypothetical protein
MLKDIKVQCDSKPKLFLIDAFDVDMTTTVKVYVFNTKHSVKQYCKDTEVPFQEGFQKLFDENV